MSPVVRGNVHECLLLKFKSKQPVKALEKYFSYGQHKIPPKTHSIDGFDVIIIMLTATAASNDAVSTIIMTTQVRIVESTNGKS
jgi:hypothetical protein